MKILILAQEYPSDGNIYRNHYIHTRLKTYLEKNIELVVLSFSTVNSYNFEGVEIVSESDYYKNFKGCNFDLVIVHAPNIRNHFRFLIKNRSFGKLLFVIHGHEVLFRSKYYPKPFKFKRGMFFPVINSFNNFYDLLKLVFLKKYFVKGIKKKSLYFIFVSEWMKKEFLKNVKLSADLLNDNSIIIPNPVGENFIENSYNCDETKLADFITVRPIDRSKHSIDIVVKAAEQNPNFSFHVYGEGDYFKHNVQPKNLKVFSKYISHSELPELLDNYRAAMMPTRLDSQGVMMCEMAMYGIPVITSDLPICREMLDSFNNICFIDNNKVKFNADKFLTSISCHKIDKKKFLPEETILKEIDLVKSVSQNQK
ncbi:MAG: glycosyltransferase family 4 protein [Ignavibacteriae bacterium]|nr:glycosyltransferase family 1 protein [Ignavibacteriota bacterium]NOG98218.1 glycosyltransferase family 4 protein [Ignavibacteriota bacterium]